jgi:hypothetical protein
MRRTHLEQLRQPGRVCGPAVHKVTYCPPTSVNGYTASCSTVGFIKGLMRETEELEGKFWFFSPPYVQ